MNKKNFIHMKIQGINRGDTTIKRDLFLSSCIIRGNFYKNLSLNVPFYANGIPQILSKDDIRGQKERLIHRKAAKTRLVLSTTSGSTGRPLEFYQSEYDRIIIHECYSRLYRFLPKTSYRAIAIRDFDSSDKDTDPLKVISYTPPRCSKTKIVHKFRFLSSKETCDRLAEIIWREQPGLLTGFISAIYLAARVLLKQNRALESVEAICPCGEYICESYRPVIAEAFPRAKIYDRYGVQELGTLAWECPLCGKYHFNSDFFAFHPIGDDRFAISKRFISGFQLVNYDVGDHLRFVGIGECEINLPTIEILEGRRDDILIDEKGKPLPIMPYHLGGMKELIQWQIIQQPDLSLDVNAIVEKETCDIAQQLEKHIRQSLRDFKLPIRIHFVRQITTTRKLKRVISNVQHDI